jgi:hypothetical protein
MHASGRQPTATQPRLASRAMAGGTHQQGWCLNPRWSQPAEPPPPRLVAAACASCPSQGACMPAEAKGTEPLSARRVMHGWPLMSAALAIASHVPGRCSLVWQRCLGADLTHGRTAINICRVKHMVCIGMCRHTGVHGGAGRPTPWRGYNGILHKRGCSPLYSCLRALGLHQSQSLRL